MLYLYYYVAILILVVIFSFEMENYDLSSNIAPENRYHESRFKVPKMG